MENTFTIRINKFPSGRQELDAKLLDVHIVLTTDDQNLILTNLVLPDNAKLDDELRERFAASLKTLDTNQEQHYSPISYNPYARAMYYLDKVSGDYDKTVDKLLSSVLFLVESNEYETKREFNITV